VVPKKSKFISYYRVSTLKQGKSGLGLEAQKSAVKSYLDANEGVELASFTEVESGKVDARPKLDVALLRCKQTGAMLLVAKLDRLSRNAGFLFNLRDAGVKFQALDLPEATTLTVGIMATLAQHERELISQRTKAALEACKARGVRLGNPNGSRALRPFMAQASAAGCAVNSAKARQRAQLIAPNIQEAKSAGCTTLRQIADYLDRLGVNTPRGKKWTATAVANAQKLISG